MTPGVVKVLLVFGTRPEVIKLSPVLRALRAAGRAFDVRVCVTAQHRDLLDPLLELFEIRPDVDLDVMRHDQTPADVIARVLAGLAPVLAGGPGGIDGWRPHWLLVQGDTTTTMAAALAAKMQGVRVAHVEAGLRTGRFDDPFPEEINRRAVGQIADLHFAPTAGAREHLLREGVTADRVIVTGNTAIDALCWAAAEPRPPVVDRWLDGVTGDVVLVTAHRRESFGAPIARICGALADLAARCGPSIRIICPVHPNPHVDGPVREHLTGVPGITLTPPIGYLEFVHLMKAAKVILTDSGGIQEEAPALGKPVLVLRDVTERPEGVAAGVARVVGTDPARIVAETARLLEDSDAYARMSMAANPYGDGHAAERIVAALSGID